MGPNYIDMEGSCTIIDLGEGNDIYCNRAPELGLPECGEISTFEDEIGYVSAICDARSDCVVIVAVTDLRIEFGYIQAFQSNRSMRGESCLVQMSTKSATLEDFQHLK